MTDETSDFARIRSIAVHREDVATALEATLRSDKRVVLRITPPFSGRMRARLHALGSESESDSGTKPASDSDSEGGSESDSEGSPDEAGGAILVDPRTLVGEVPPYPEVDDTAEKYPDADVETRRERHAEAVAAWRERVRKSVVSSVAISGDGENEESRTVDVTVLG